MDLTGPGFKQLSRVTANLISYKKLEAMNLSDRCITTTTKHGN